MALRRVTRTLKLAWGSKQFLLSNCPSPPSEVETIKSKKGEEEALNGNVEVPGLGVLRRLLPSWKAIFHKLSLDSFLRKNFADSNGGGGEGGAARDQHGAGEARHGR